MRQQFTEEFRNQTFWTKDGDIMPWLGGDTYDGSITVDNEVLAPTGRDDAAVVAIAAANKILITPDNGTVSLEFRVRSDGSANDSNVLELYAECGVDHYTRVATLACLQGTQVDTGSIYFTDTITESNLSWPSGSREVVFYTGGDNHIASYIINTNGYNKFLFVLSTLTSTTVYVDFRRI